MTQTKMTLAEIEDLAARALISAGASPKNARSVARSTMLAERDGIRSHGLLYVPIYADHLLCGKVVGTAIPIVNRPRSGAVTVDAKNGFAHPAIDAGWSEFMTAAHENGVAVMTLRESYNCGVLGHHAERIAEENLLGLCFTHAPASIAPIGGHKPVIGTNPFALAVPDGSGNAAFVIDQSASVIAKSEVLLRSRNSEKLEPGWAFDSDGKPTIDPEAALKGSMAPSGGYKGFGIGLLVEIMASALAGAVSSIEASPFSGPAGGPPRTGQCFVAIDPGGFSGSHFYSQVNALLSAIVSQPGARLPGLRRLSHRQKTTSGATEVDTAVIERISRFFTTRIQKI